MAETYTIRDISPNIRCHWIRDDDYQTIRSFAYDTEEETRKAEQAELESLHSGEYVVLGCIVQTKCQHCQAWTDRDSLWGIVISGNDKDLDLFARECMDTESN